MLKFSGKKWSEVKRLVALVLPYKGWIALSVLCTMGYNVFSAAPGWYAKDVIDAIKDEPELEKYYFVGIAIVFIFAMKGLFGFGHMFSTGLMVQRLLSTLRLQLFERLQQLSLSFFDKSRTGDLIARFTNDIQVLQAALNVGVTGPFRDIPLVFILLGMMIYRSWQLSLLLMIVIPIALVCIQSFGRRNKKAVGQRQASFGELANFLMETFTGIRVIKAFGMEKYEIARFKNNNDQLYDHNIRSVLITAYSSPIIESIGAIAGAVIFIYGGHLVDQNVITIGDIASFFVLFFMLNDPIKKLNGFNLKLQEGVAAVERVYSIMDQVPEVEDVPNALPLTEFKDEIEIQISSFQYESQEQPALQDIHLKVKKGEVIALVGSSGAGKSTFINLIPRFYEVPEGVLKIDGIDIKKVQLRSLRALISIVTQETILFNDTILNNITYGQPECPEEKMLAASIASNAHDFIIAQPQGYQTPIGEKGVKLSGGQRQRLAIARALLKDAPILILDEATSALDAESEIEVQQAIEHLMENRTSFVIAHRLSTIRHAHRICVLEEGKIIQIGTHEELLEKGGRYRQLYEMQFQNQKMEKPSGR
ncbi:MAG: ABC transporter ATP-binding protein [SAR324 cluster bacterium]|nr:ABC transporter ATP-binding protein [SAR324 cluster bacterium]